MLYFKYLKILLKSSMQYRLSFWLMTIGQFFVSFFSIVGMYLLFARFKNIAGWTFGEAALCFAVIQFSFGLSECFARGFDSFSSLIVNGDFDRVLVRPRNTIIQILGSKFEPSRIGRMIECIAVLIYALLNINVKWNIFKIVTLVFMIMSGTAIFTGIFILGATMCFFTVQGLEVINIFTDGGKEIAQYPLSIYNKWIKRFLTFIIPFGCVNYLPLMYIIGKVKNNSILYMLTPLFGIIFIFPCILVWNQGIKKYLSTGS